MNPDIFARKVLDSIELNACEQARTLLSEHAEAALPTLHTGLTAGHLDHCAECAALYQTLLKLNRQLPALRSMRAPETLISHVMQNTTASATRKFCNAWRQGLRAWLLRPRFALESAYALSAVLMLFSGLTGVNAVDIERIETLTTQAVNSGQQGVQQVAERVNHQVEFQSKQIETTYHQTRMKMQVRLQTWVKENYAAAVNALQNLQR